MENKVEVFQWLEKQKAPFSIRLQIFQAFQLYELIVEMDKKIIVLEERLRESV
ncbi:hypothetical protein [Bacillus cereus group sp. BfR-BA-01380]|uniref:hypothetical protein n=1 Tax=Bacillus cereus group sp. BfR-BA-01380 TaxID=2920324 RepID=UPI001F592718|nr:hypothetical protein [Bacillus cereus group sp. BfR-BA-01380]